MTSEEIEKTKKEIDNLSQLEMAGLWRFGESGHPYFDVKNKEISDYFVIKFKEKGGMTPEISKRLGWER